MLDMPRPPRCADYAIVKRAIEFISTRWRDQPSVEAIASQVGLSPSHFQHVFKRWAGLTPKAFLQAITIDGARELLRDSASVLDAAYDVGLSGPSRLHDLFVAHEALTPGDYRRDDLVLAYGFHASPFGEAIVVAAPRGMAGLGFVDDGEPRGGARRHARGAGRARIRRGRRARPRLTPRRAFDPALWRPDAPLRVVMIGTDFEVRVWETLLSVPLGRATTYSDIARKLGKPKAARAVGAAVGQESDLVRRPLSSRARPLGRADRLPLGPGAQAGDHRLGGGAARRTSGPQRRESGRERAAVASTAVGSSPCARSPPAPSRGKGRCTCARRPRRRRRAARVGDAQAGLPHPAQDVEIDVAARALRRLDVVDEADRD